jgi:hypothetical protein
LIDVDLPDVGRHVLPEKNGGQIGKTSTLSLT